MRAEITLACAEYEQRNCSMAKDKKTYPDHIETRKYCRLCKRYIMHGETK